jgi:hypothetical protein
MQNAHKAGVTLSIQANAGERHVGIATAHDATSRLAEVELVAAPAAGETRLVASKRALLAAVRKRAASYGPYDLFGRKRKRSPTRRQRMPTLADSNADECRRSPTKTPTVADERRRGCRRRRRRRRERRRRRRRPPTNADGRRRRRRRTPTLADECQRESLTKTVAESAMNGAYGPSSLQRRSFSANCMLTNACALRRRTRVAGGERSPTEWCALCVWSADPARPDAARSLRWRVAVLVTARRRPHCERHGAAWRGRADVP